MEVARKDVSVRVVPFPGEDKLMIEMVVLVDSLEIYKKERNRTKLESTLRVRLFNMIKEL